MDDKSDGPGRRGSLGGPSGGREKAERGSVGTTVGKVGETDFTVEDIQREGTRQKECRDWR